MNHIDRMKEIRNQRAEKAAELKNFAFSATINFENLSINELDDLLALNVGESTYIFNQGDVTKIA